jgi:integrative and conjugative element protein (TIGR02256 family)
MSLKIPLGNSGELVILTDTVLEHFQRHQQQRKRDTEAGGQLFGRIQGTTITIEEATGPRRSDIRSRYSYIPDRKTEQREINERFPSGLHFIGDWHTHPEPIPHPSRTDLDNMRECVKKSRRAVSGFLLIIVGTAPLPGGLHASLHNGIDTLVLHMADEHLPTEDQAGDRAEGSRFEVRE